MAGRKQESHSPAEQLHRGYGQNNLWRSLSSGVVTAEARTSRSLPTKGHALTSSGTQPCSDSLQSEKGAEKSTS